MSSIPKTGKLYLIGAGPGDPELLTLKAHRILQVCDVVLYDRLVSPEILSWARPDAELIYVGKHEGEQDQTQSQIFSLIEQHARAGRTIARLKGGDPLIFGRGAEEWSLALEHGIEAELIPGITSAIAVPGLAGIPLTHRHISQSFAVVTGHCQQGLKNDWSDFARIDTLVILKNRLHLFIAVRLLNNGSSKPPSAKSLPVRFKSLTRPSSSSEKSSNFVGDLVLQFQYGQRLRTYRNRHSQTKLLSLGEL